VTFTRCWTDDDGQECVIQGGRLSIYGKPSMTRDDGTVAVGIDAPWIDQLAGAVEGWERVDLLASWIDRDKREPDKILAYAQELVRLAMRHGGGQ
jgi:hypothetical protein